MTKHCRLCGKLIRTDKEVERGICDECFHNGFLELGKVLGNMRKEHGKDR